MSKIKVIIYEDNSSLRTAISELIKQESDMELCGAFANCLSIEEHLSKLKPAVILMDIDMPERNGIEGVGLAKKMLPDVNILMFTVFDDNDRVFQAVCAGAYGYLLKDVPPEHLLGAIRELNAGGAPMSPSVARKVLNAFAVKLSPKTTTTSEIEKLSDREQEVLQFLSQGYSYQMIADKLSQSVHTTRTHVRRIYQKLHVHNVAEAIAKVFLHNK